VSVGSFQLGRIVATRTCVEALRRSPGESDLLVQLRDVMPLLRRHAKGDWGDVTDPWVNDRAVDDGTRVLSVYEVCGTTIWIITDGETNACAACFAGIGECEPDSGTWEHDAHWRDDLPPRRLSTTVLLPTDY
jgi:hypothetical protein